MKKITINHYLNKSVKPRIKDKKEYYPLYIQVIANRTNYRFKSKFPFNDGYLRDIDLLQEFVINSIEGEKNELQKIISFMLESNQLELMTAETIKLYSNNLWDVLNNNFKILFEKECKVLPNSCPDVFLISDYYDINEILKFTESEIEYKFSEQYQKCKMGMSALLNALWDKDLKNLKIIEITVFDYLKGDGMDRVMKAVKSYNVFCGNKEGEEQKEYSDILEEIRKLIFT